MEKRGITQRQLSEETGIAVTTIGRMCNNYISRIDLANLATLAKYFEVKEEREILELVIE